MLYNITAIKRNNKLINGTISKISERKQSLLRKTIEKNGKTFSLIKLLYDNIATDLIVLSVHICC